MNREEFHNLAITIRGIDAGTSKNKKKPALNESVQMQGDTADELASLIKLINSANGSSDAGEVGPVSLPVPTEVGVAKDGKLDAPENEASDDFGNSSAFRTKMSQKSNDNKRGYYPKQDYDVDLGYANDEPRWQDEYDSKKGGADQDASFDMGGYGDDEDEFDDNNFDDNDAAGDEFDAKVRGLSSFESTDDDDFDLGDFDSDAEDDLEYDTDAGLEENYEEAELSDEAIAAMSLMLNRRIKNAFASPGNKVTGVNDFVKFLKTARTNSNDNLDKAMSLIKFYQNGEQIDAADAYDEAEVGGEIRDLGHELSGGKSNKAISGRRKFARDAGPQPENEDTDTYMDEAWSTKDGRELEMLQSLVTAAAGRDREATMKFTDHIRKEFKDVDATMLLRKLTKMDKSTVIQKLHDLIRDSERAGDTDDSEVFASMEEYANEPDEKYMGTNYMTQDLAGGINKPKKSYGPSAGGDNPMNVESLQASLRKELRTKLGEGFSKKKVDEAPVKGRAFPANSPKGLAQDEEAALAGFRKTIAANKEQYDVLFKQLMTATLGGAEIGLSNYTMSKARQIALRIANEAGWNGPNEYLLGLAWMIESKMIQRRPNARWRSHAGSSGLEDYSRVFEQMLDQHMPDWKSKIGTLSMKDVFALSKEIAKSEGRNKAFAPKIQAWMISKGLVKDGEVVDEAPSEFNTDAGVEYLLDKAVPTWKTSKTKLSPFSAKQLGRMLTKASHHTGTEPISYDDIMKYLMTNGFIGKPVREAKAPVKKAKVKAKAKAKISEGIDPVEALKQVATKRVSSSAPEPGAKKDQAMTDIQKLAGI